MSIFGSENLITSFTSIDKKLNISYVGFDLGEFRYDELSDLILDAIVDFTYGFHKGILESSYNRKILRESAKSIYEINEFNEVKKIYVDNNGELDDKIKDKYLKRGEFGELILHLLLRDFHNSVPLISKIYFKDSYGHPVHGFDSVHIAPDINNPQQFSFWFGESKLYNDGSNGVKALVKDIEEHFNKDYLKKEFVLLSKKKDAYLPLAKFQDLNKKQEYEEFLKLKDEWFTKLDSVNKLEDILSSATIPMLCIYSSDTFAKHNNEKSKEFLEDLENEIENLRKNFEDKLTIPIPTTLNIVLFLFPVPSKKELVKRLHIKLSHMQAM